MRGVVSLAAGFVHSVADARWQHVSPSQPDYLYHVLCDTDNPDIVGFSLPWVIKN
jgi:hypothetical protein